jgi:glycerate 2-kinase
MRQNLLSIYKTAISAVNGRKTVAAYLAQHTCPTPLALIAVGKAATDMAVGAFDVLGSQITKALVITKFGHLNKQALQDYPVLCLESAHPVPDESSLIAGQSLLDFIENLPPQYPILFLISGGTSALVEVLVSGISLADLQRTNRWLLASGLDIHTINQIRKSLSAIKGGRLANYLKGHPVLNLLISDVPGDDFESIGSGLLTQPKMPLKSFLKKEQISLPDWLHTLITRTSDYPCDFSNIKQELIAHPAIARNAASQAAKAFGYTTFNHNELIIGEAKEAGRILAQQLCTGNPGLFIWSSETTVYLPEKPGQGGRCQSLALAAACEIVGQKDVFLLAGGTDGNDGPGQMAGALVDGGTVKRGKQKGFNATHCLEQADAGRFLAASRDLIETGPTGTNVMDILIGLKAKTS